MAGAPRARLEHSAKVRGENGDGKKDQRQLSTPLNVRRSVLHFITALSVSSLLVLVPMIALAALAFSVTASFWMLEMFKDRDVAIVDEIGLFCARHFGARPSEMHEVNGITWYVTGLAATSLIGLFLGPEPCIVGVLTLGFGDPAAAWFGRRFGRMRFRNGKSAEGFIAFVLVSISVSWVFLSTLRLGSVRFSGIVLGALGGAVAEVVCPGEQSYINDNVLIPVVAAVMSALV